MSKIEECTHMELYEIAFTEIELVGSKIILCLYLYDITTKIITKRVSLSISNVPGFMKAGGIKKITAIHHSTIRCLINKFREINYISLTEDEWFVCKDLHMQQRD